MVRRKTAPESGANRPAPVPADAAVWDMPWGQDLISFALAAGFTIRPVFDIPEALSGQELPYEKPPRMAGASEGRNR